MNGHLQQIVALAINGNAMCNGVSIDGFWPDGAAFIFDHETSFHTTKKRWFKDEWVKTSADPIGWFSQKALGYRIHYGSRSDLNTSDRMASGFANGGPRWLIEAVHRQTSSFWEGQMEVSHPDATDNRIWTTRYYCIGRDQPATATGEIDLEGMRDRLHSALENIYAFSMSQKSGFAKTFADALVELNSKAPNPFGWNKNILPAGFEISLAAHQLLASAQLGYVFGGMGSWNDQYWSDANVEAECNLVSNELFTSLNDAVVAATNSTYSGG